LFEKVFPIAPDGPPSFFFPCCGSVRCTITARPFILVSPRTPPFKISFVSRFQVFFQGTLVDWRSLFTYPIFAVWSPTGSFLTRGTLLRAAVQNFGPDLHLTLLASSFFDHAPSKTTFFQKYSGAAGHLFDAAPQQVPFLPPSVCLVSYG